MDCFSCCFGHGYTAASVQTPLTTSTHGYTKPGGQRNERETTTKVRQEIKDEQPAENRSNMSPSQLSPQVDSALQRQRIVEKASCTEPDKAGGVQSSQSPAVELMALTPVSEALKSKRNEIISLMLADLDDNALIDITDPHGNPTGCHFIRGWGDCSISNVRKQHLINPALCIRSFSKIGPEQSIYFKDYVQMMLGKDPSFFQNARFESRKTPVFLYELKCPPNTVMSGATWVNMSPKGSDFSKSNLNSINISKGDWRNSNFSGTCLSSAKMVEMQASGADFTRANLSGAAMTGPKKYSGSSLRRAILCGANLSGATITQTDMKSANFSCANLNGALLSGTFEDSNFIGADLTGAALNEVNVHDPDLERTFMKGTNFSCANLNGALISGPFNKTNFKGAILKGATLNGVNMDNPDWNDPRLKGALF